jgi:hypothetical protein
VIHRRAYGALLHLYPRRFRREWETELLQAFDDQLVRPIRPTRHPAARAWLATTSDLARTVPRQRMEQFMDRTSAFWRRFSIARPVLVAVGAAALLIGGRFILLPVVLIAGLVLAARKRDSLSEVLTSGLRWFEYLGIGAGLLFAIALGSFLVPDDIPSGLGETLWLLAFTSFVAGWSFILFGVLSGATSLWRRIRPNTAA